MSITIRVGSLTYAVIDGCPSPTPPPIEGLEDPLFPLIKEIQLLPDPPAFFAELTFPEYLLSPSSTAKFEASNPIFDKLKESIKKIDAIKLSNESLQKLSQIYQTYIEQVCQAEGEQREKLLSGPVRLYQLLHGNPTCLQVEQNAGRLMLSVRRRTPLTPSNIDLALFPDEQDGTISFHPGRAYAAKSLYTLISDQPWAPTELLRASNVHNGQIRGDFILQTSPNILGVNFCEFLRSAQDSKSINSYSFTAQFFFSLLAMPSEGRAENYSATDHSYQIVNDINIFGAPFFQAATGGHFVEIKTIFFLLPEMMNHPLDAQFVAHFLSLNPAFLLIKWLASLETYNTNYKNLLNQGVLTTQNDQLLPLQVRVCSSTLKFVFDTLQKIQNKLKENSQLTHWELLSFFSPSLCLAYQSILKTADNNPLTAHDMLFSEEDLISSYAPPGIVKVTFTETTIEQALQEWLLIVLPTMASEDQERLLTHLSLSFPRLSSLTLKDLPLNDYTLIDLFMRSGKEHLVHLFLDPMSNELKENTEEKQYLFFEEACEKGDILEQALSLEKLAALYIGRKDYTTAAHLFNATYSLAKRNAFHPCYLAYLIKKLEQVENLFLKERLGVSLSVPPSGFLEKYRRHLDVIRAHGKTFLQQGVPPAAIQSEMTYLFQELLCSLIKESMQLLGEPPTKYAVIGLGSLSREEMCPYSDVEFAFLIEEETPEIKTYFRNLAQLTLLKMINMGETKWDLIRPRRIGNEMQAAQSMTCSGFSFDSGGLHPLGKAGIYELIGTPAQLAEFQSKEWLDKNNAEIILSNAMTTIRFLMGDSFLAVKYEEAARTILRQPSKEGIFTNQLLAQLRASNLIDGFAKEFEPKLDWNKIDLRGFDVKKELYRLPHTIVGGLALYYGITSKNTFKRIDELQNLGVFNAKGARNLQETLCEILAWRIEAHISNKEEKEIYYHPQNEQEEKSEGLLFISSRRAQKLQEIYRVLIPLKQAADNFAKGRTNAFNQGPLYNSKIGVVSQGQEKRFRYQDANTTYTQAVSLNPNNPQALEALGRVKGHLGEFSQSLTSHKARYEILKQTYHKPHQDLVLSLTAMGQACTGLGDLEQAMDCAEQALAMQKQLTGDRKRPGVGIAKSGVDVGLEAMGHTMIHYTTAHKTDKYNVLNTLEHHQKELAQKKRLFGETPNLSIAFTLMNLGEFYFRSTTIKMNLRLERSVNCYEQALTMLDQIYEGKPNPKKINCLKGLCRAYLLSGEFPKATEYVEKILAMLKQVYREKIHTITPSLWKECGDVKKVIGDFKGALQWYHEQYSYLKKLHDDTPDQDLVISLISMAQIHMTLGELQQALGYGEEAASMQKQLNGCQDYLGISIYSTAMGHLYTWGAHSGNTKVPNEEKIDRNMQVLANQKKFFGDIAHPNIASTLINLGRFYYVGNSSKRSIDYYTQAMVMLNQLYVEQPHPRKTDCLSGLGLAFNKSGNPAKGYEYAENALAMLKQIYGEKAYPIVVDALNNLSLICKNLGKIEEANDYAEQAKTMKSKL